MPQTAQRQKYTYADHLDAHPEIATRENLEAINRLRASGWRQRSKIVEVSAMADRLKVSNSGTQRLSQHRLVDFLDSLVAPLHYAVVIKERGIVVGSEVFGSKVKKIGRDRRLYLENGVAQAPSYLDPEYHIWVSSLYGR